MLTSNRPVSRNQTVLELNYSGREKIGQGSGKGLSTSDWERRVIAIAAEEPEYAGCKKATDKDMIHPEEEAADTVRIREGAPLYTLPLSIFS